MHLSDGRWNKDTQRMMKRGIFDSYTCTYSQVEARGGQDYERINRDACVISGEGEREEGFWVY